MRQLWSKEGLVTEVFDAKANDGTRIKLQVFNFQFVQIDLLVASCDVLIRELFTIVIMGTSTKTA